MAAIETAFRALKSFRPEAKSVQFGFPYVDSLKIQQRLGAGVHFFPRGDLEELEQLSRTAADEPLLGLFCEFPGNPLLASPDLNRIEELSNKHDFPVLVDDTLGALINVDVLRAADLVSCSLTKFFSGAGDVMAGSLTLNPRGPRATRLREAIEAEYEDLLDAEDAVVLEHNSADCVEARAANQPDGRAALRHSSHASSGGTNRVSEVSNAGEFSGVSTCGPGLRRTLLPSAQEAGEKCAAFFDALQIAKGPNLGTNFSLCCPYTILAHFKELDFVEQCGISRYLLRVSVGLEDADGLIARFLDALDSLPA